MRTIPALTSIAAAISIAGCATQGAQQPTARGPDPRSPAPQSPVASRHPFEVEGKVQSVSGGVLGVGRNITISRDEAPPAVLRVADETRITVDGKVSNLSGVQPGADVRVRFDFDGSTPVAIEIDAKPSR